MITRQFDIILNTKILNTLTSNMIVTQNDKDTNILKIKVFDGDSEIDYTQVDHARIFFEKRDKEVIQGDLTKVSDGFTYQMGTNEIACNGEVLTIIHLYGSNNERLATSKFKFEVERDLENKNAIKSSSQYSALETIIVEFREEVSKLQEEVNKIIAEGSTNIPEVINARHSNVKNKDFNVVGDRLDDIEKNMQNIDMSSQLEPIHDKISILEEANTVQTADLTNLEKEVMSHQADYASLFINNVDAKNSIYRGKYLGASVTSEQYLAISNGTFDDLYIGDYWTINGVNYRIAGFDYYYNTGDTACTTHHVVIVPDTYLYTHVMNDTNTTISGYTGSKMYIDGLEQAKATIFSAFGGHILTHRQLLCNATVDGKSSGWAWFDSTIELMNEIMVYGSSVFGDSNLGGCSGYNIGIGKTQLPLFKLNPKIINMRQEYWLRDVVSPTSFVFRGDYGEAAHSIASSARGVCPAFSIS